MLKADGISFRYKGTPWLFKHVDLEVKPGEVVGLYGLSGSGKTTMAKVFSGYLDPLEGKVSVDGRTYPIKGRQPVQLVWQHPEKAINPRWRMKKLIDECDERNSALLTYFGIKDDWLNRYPSELSGGELQRFCLVRAFRSDTKYIIADEMTTMLDAITQAQIWHRVAQLVHQRNIGILAISHNNHLLDKICDRIINFDELILK